MLIWRYIFPVFFLIGMLVIFGGLMGLYVAYGGITGMIGGLIALFLAHAQFRGQGSSAFGR
jgi:hypothetical protein